MPTVMATLTTTAGDTCLVGRTDDPIPAGTLVCLVVGDDCRVYLATLADEQIAAETVEIDRPVSQPEPTDRPYRPGIRQVGPIQ